ncbi:MAG: anthranilate phosphoribosyltransferase [Alphaproteobacteria bacterium]|nr:anthranilate phosphoribosyltransferase [Alphaproteobacteria bacterium]
MTFPDGKTPLSEEDMITTMSAIMEGRVDEDDLSTFLVNMNDRGETVEELTGAARVMREKATSLKAPYGAVDCCGTGGDKSGTYNISTAVALVAAACGVPVAKHGNRAASSKSGAADVLEVLGVNLDMTRERLEAALETLHFAFLMAPNHHQAMKHVVPVRKKLGRRTIFNLLGPLANPAGTRLQLIGVFDKQWLEPMAETLRNLGTKRAWVVHGSDGLDEITVTGPTSVAVLDQEGNIENKTITTEHFDLPVHDLEKLKGGDAEENAQALRAVLEGQKCAYRDIVVANTAAVLVVHGKKETLAEGAKLAKSVIDDGVALQTLKDYVAFSRGIE